MSVLEPEKISQQEKNIINRFREACCAEMTRVGTSASAEKLDVDPLAVEKFLRSKYWTITEAIRISIALGLL